MPGYGSCNPDRQAGFPKEEFAAEPESPDSGKGKSKSELRKKLRCSSGMEVFIMKLVPLGDRVVLKQLEAETTTKSGIVLPGQEKEKPQQAEVIAVGPGGVVDGKEIKMEVKAGDKVIYSKYSGTEVKFDDNGKYVIVKQSDILAIIE